MGIWPPLFSKITHHVFSKSELSSFVGWFNQVPAEYRNNHPKLCLFAAIVKLFIGESLDAIVPLYKIGVTSIDRPETSGEVLTFRSLMCVMKGRPEKAMEQAEKALTLLPSDAFFFEACLSTKCIRHSFFIREMFAHPSR